ncbi:MAG: LUD domain-containing protein [Pirellulales bacterium]
MPTTRDSILSAVRRNRPAKCAAPDINADWTTYADRRQQFVDVLTAVGGQAVYVRDLADLNAHLSRLPAYANANIIASRVPGVGTPNVDLASLTAPHELADLDIAILPGRFAVAENAAVWVDDRDLPFRVIYFLCQHLVLVVPANEIVDHLHVAYDRLAGAFAKPSFGAFISGPSKTADIEQSLVTGAHGPRSLTVFLLGD